MLLISSSVSLIAIVAGMFLYAKTIKDGLNRFFKFVALFIIIIGFFNFFLAEAFFSVKSIYKYAKHHDKMKMKCNEHHGSKMEKQCYKYGACDVKSDSCEDKMMAGHEMMEGKHCCLMMDAKNMMHGKSSHMKCDMIIKKDSLTKN